MAATDPTRSSGRSSGTAGARRWRAVNDTPLESLARALVNHDALYGNLVELGMSAAGADRCSRLRACGFDTQNKWHWVDVDLDPSVLGTWLNTVKQARLRDLLSTQILFVKDVSTDERTGVRVWWRPRGAKRGEAALRRAHRAPQP